MQRGRWSEANGLLLHAVVSACSPGSSQFPAEFGQVANGTVRPTWCEIDLGAIDHNVGQLRSILGSGVKIFACMKSDAMGCGAIAVSRQCEASGVDGLAFGTIDSAIACRREGVRLPILLYPTCLPETAPVLAEFDLMGTISTLDDVHAWSAATLTSLGVFLKIDVGGFRAGAFPREALAVAEAIVASEKLELRGVYGHIMSSYGLDDVELIGQQAGQFSAVISRLSGAAVLPDICMISSSDTVLRYPDLDFNAVDPGRPLMGLEFPSGSERARDWQDPLRAIKTRYRASR